MSEQHSAPDSPTAELDITREICPMTFVRTRLALDRLASGAVLQVRLTGAEPLRNVPRSAMQQGHAVLQTTAQPDGSTLILIRRR
jgi:tRNA 2-thiouridine synthesizing protein A